MSPAFLPIIRSYQSSFCHTSSLTFVSCSTIIFLWTQKPRTHFRSLSPSFILPKGLILCTGKCDCFVGLSLIPLSLVCIVANALLLVPNGETTWTNYDHLSLQIWFMASFIRGGLMVRRLAKEHRPGV